MEDYVAGGTAASVRPLPSRNLSSSAKARPLDGDCEESPPLLPNQAFEAAFLWKAAYAAPKPRKCATPGCTKERVGVFVFCPRCEVTDALCARDRPLPRRGRYQTRASPIVAATEDEAILDPVRLRDEFCGDVVRYKQVVEAEALRRLNAEAAHAVRAALLAAAERCGEPGCTKPRAFGVKGTNKPEFCRDHKEEGMVNLCLITRCRHHRCTRSPVYGVQGTRVVEFCREHRKMGMVCETQNKCTFSGCAKVASFAPRTKRKHAEVCSQHAKAGMVNVVTGRFKREENTNTNTDDLQIALTGAGGSSNGSKKRARRVGIVGILQRTSPIQPPEPDVAVKKEIDDSSPSTAEANARKVGQRARGGMRLRRDNYMYMGGW